MDMTTRPEPSLPNPLPTPPERPDEPTPASITELLDPSGLSRRGFLRGAAIAGGGLVAATIASCTPAGAPTWTYPPGKSPAPNASGAAASDAHASHEAASASPAPSAGAAASAAASPSEPIPAGWTQHDVDARHGRPALPRQPRTGPQGHLRRRRLRQARRHPRRRRRLPRAEPEAGLRPGPAARPERHPPAAQADARRRRQGLQPDDRRDRAAHRRAQATGRRARLQQAVAGPDDPGHPGRPGSGGLQEQPEGDDRRPLPRRRVRRLLPGRRPVRHPDADRAGSTATRTSSPPRTQARSCTTPTTTRRTRSGAACSGRSSSIRRTTRSKYDREYIWISNDSLGGFTINGHGFPATVPVLAAVGETVRIRFMNEGIMMHPWHSHGYVMKVVERDGRPARQRRLRVRHARASTRASAMTRSSPRSDPACGRSTATSCRTSRERRACSAWSTP